MKNHLPYNVLLVATVVAIGLMAIFNLYARQSGFAVHVGYAIPLPPAQEAPPPTQIATPPQILPPPTVPLAQTPPATPESLLPPSPPLPEPLPPVLEPPPTQQEEPYANWHWVEQEFYEPMFFEPEPVVHFPIELNAATSEQLQLVRGIGPAIAQRIIDHRWQIGGFTHLSQLLEVSGIGPATFDRMSPYFFVAGQHEWEIQRWEQDWAEYQRLMEIYLQHQWQQEADNQAN
ncbi:MAG: helix-hairpin-helix domain-containing protein [Oscillospiraceae bacterium]|nr:helix-hairpin-helix domain-containing protein [Oscillospiraceae bacterium]